MTGPTVVHLITRYLDGGAERTTKHTLEALQADETPYDLHLGTGAEYYANRLEKLEAMGVKTTVFSQLRHYSPLGAVRAVRAVEQYLRHVDADIVHTHSTEMGIVGRWAGFLARTPVVVHEIHGDPIAADHRRLLNAFILMAERVTAPVTDRFIVKSKRIQETYLERGIGDCDRYELIYHGVDLDRFTSNQRNHKDGNRLRLLFVGRLAEGKGLFDLLDGVERLKNVRLDIAGDGPLLEVLETEVEQRNLPINLLGYREDVPELLAETDVFVLPSYREGTPRVITEALAAGVPVVSTAIAGIPEQVVDGETGFLVEPGDVDALVASIENLRRADRRRAFGVRAREQVKRFSKETAADRYRAFYRDLSVVV